MAKIPPLCPVKGGDFQDGYILVPDCEAEGGDVAMTFEQAAAAATVIHACSPDGDVTKALLAMVDVMERAGNPLGRMLTATDLARNALAKLGGKG